MKAITPQQALKTKGSKTLPADIIGVVNKLIVANLSHGIATIGQDEIVKALVKKGYTRSELFDKNLLDFEETFRAAGWKVEYDKPAYNETYPATFTFKVKNRNPMSMTDASA